MSDFNNGVVNGIYYTRFIASWTKMCTKINRVTRYGDDFKDWLRSMGISEDEVAAIHELADCGKLELETNAKRWMTGTK